MKSDAQLKRDIEAELDWDPSVNASRIGVEVKDGIVTLAGYLDSYLEKMAAVRAAERVVGVRGVAVELEVKLPGISQRTDADIAKAAIGALRWNAFVPQDAVRVEVEHGRITLLGEVNWDYQRGGAEAAVRGITGVKGVQNQVAIRHRPAAGDIKTKIEAALQRAAHFDAQDIHITLDGGKVTLEGEVPSLQQRRVVEQTVRAAQGVSAVDNRLVVAP